MEYINIICACASGVMLGILLTLGIAYHVNKKEQRRRENKEDK